MPESSLSSNYPQRPRLTVGTIAAYAVAFVTGGISGVALHRYIVLPISSPNMARGELLLSVVAGVVSGFLVLLLGRITREWALPHYMAIVYRGVDVSGEWYFSSDEMAQSGTLTVNQTAGRIGGTLTLVSTWAADHMYDRMRTFHVAGEIANRFVQLTVQHVDPSRLGVGGFLLELAGDGRRMKGHYVFHSVIASEITSAEVTLFRPGASSHPAQPDLPFLNDLDSPESTPDEDSSPSDQEATGETNDEP